VGGVDDAIERRALAAPVLEDIEEIVPFLRAERGEAPVVEDEDVDLRPAGEDPGQRAVAAGDVQFVAEPRHAAVEDGVAVATRLLPERAGEGERAVALRLRELLLERAG